MIPNKAFYMAVHDLRHLSKYFGVPLGNLEVIYTHTWYMPFALFTQYTYVPFAIMSFFNAIFLQSSLLFLLNYWTLSVYQDITNVMFEKGSLSAQRLLTAVKEELPHKLEEVSRQLWLRIWSRVSCSLISFWYGL